MDGQSIVGKDARWIQTALSGPYGTAVTITVCSNFDGTIQCAFRFIICLDLLRSLSLVVTKIYVARIHLSHVDQTFFHPPTITDPSYAQCQFTCWMYLHHTFLVLLPSFYPHPPSSTPRLIVPTTCSDNTGEQRSVTIARKVGVSRVLESKEAAGLHGLAGAKPAVRYVAGSVMFPILYHDPGSYTDTDSFTIFVHRRLWQARPMTCIRRNIEKESMGRKWGNTIL